MDIKFSNITIKLNLRYFKFRTDTILATLIVQKGLNSIGNIRPKVEKFS